MQIRERERLQEISDQRGESIVARGMIADLRQCSQKLYEACQSMLKTTGGSERWNGETHESLRLIEDAVALYERTTGLA